MIAYLDTSSLVKLYVEEEGSHLVRETIGAMGSGIPKMRLANGYGVLNNMIHARSTAVVRDTRADRAYT